MIDEILRELVGTAVREAVRPLERELRDLRAAVSAGPARWLSRREAAEALGISTDTIDRQVRDGTLQVRRAGRAIRVLVAPPATDYEIAALAAETRR